MVESVPRGPAGGAEFIGSHDADEFVRPVVARA